MWKHGGLLGKHIVNKLAGSFQKKKNLGAVLCWTSKLG